MIASAQKSTRIRRKQGDSLERFIHKNFIAVRLEDSVQSAIAHIRKTAQKGDIFYLYVVDKDNRLCGITSMRSILFAPDHEKISNLYSKTVLSIEQTAPVHEAYQLFSSARYLSIPVIDDEKKLIGVLQAHELIDEYRDQKQQTIENGYRAEVFELLGIKAEDQDAHPIAIAFHRLPWLIINIIGGTLSAFFIHAYGENLKDAVIFLAFVPILLIVSESIGMQTASIIIAHLHRSGRGKSFLRLMARETLVSCCLGFSCAALVSFAVYCWKGSLNLTLSIALTIFTGATLVTALGNFIPYLFHRFKIDPRIAAGPVVLALSDCSTLLFYLLVAGWISNHLN